MKTAKLDRKDPRNKPAEEKYIPLAKVQIDRSTQARVKKNPEWVESLGEVLAQGRDFKDAIEVYFDGYVYWVGDGFHRLDAYERAGKLRAIALVREGTHRDAMIHAAGANSEHGLPRSRKDIRRGIALLLDDEELAGLSNRILATLAHTTDKTVADVKREMGLDDNKRTYTDKHGNVVEMDVSNLHRPKTAAAAAPVNTFHDLPGETKTVLKDVLRVIAGLNKTEYSFVLAWLKGGLPDKPKEAEQLLTELEVQEGAGEEMKF